MCAEYINIKIKYRLNSVSTVTKQCPMNVKLKEFPNTVNKKKNTKIISERIPTKTRESFAKPIVRRTSQYSNSKIKETFKQRAISLQDKANIMTTTKEDIIPEKEISDSGNNLTIQESFFMAAASSNDSLDNCKPSTYTRSNGQESNEIDEAPSITHNEDISKTTDLSQKIKSPSKPKLSTNISTSSSVSQEKAEKPIVERKIQDPKVIIEEMRRYYENEIYVLKRQLQQSGSNIQPNEEALQKRCHMLESQLRKSQNDAESLMEQVNGLKTQLQTWPNRVTELEEDNQTLRGRIEDVRAINHQRQNEIDELHEIIKNLETKLWENSTGTQQQEKVFLERLMQEYDHLLKDYDSMKMSHMKNEKKLYESRSIANDMSSKISELESKIRKIETENNFLKRRLNNERSFVNSSYRPPTDSQPPVDMGMMSLSCYGALPSYSSANDTREQINENGRRFDPLKSKINDRYNLGKMNQSMYVQSSEENSEVITPTAERRRVGIKDDKPFPKKHYQIESASFEMLNEEPEVLGNQQKSLPISDFRQGEPTHGVGRRKKPEYYNRDSWANSRADEDIELERRYDQLQNEKKQLLTKLSHIPSNSSIRNRRTNREQREGLEAQLDQIDRQLGLMRMTLKQKNILK